MTSTRLPGKVLLQAAGRSMLDHHLRRLASAGLQTIVATTMNTTDDPIVRAAHELGVPHFRGSESDVLSRFVGAAEAFGLDAVVRVTSDCPLIDGDVISNGVEVYLAHDDPNVYVSNTLVRTFPRGFDFEVFSATALREADELATDAVAREHVTPYINQNRSGRVVTVPIERSTDDSRFRVTLDTAEDYELLRRLIEEQGADSLGINEIVEVLERNPELVGLNALVEQKKLGE